VTKVFEPEHEVRGTEQVEETPGSLIDPTTGIPFVNLYSKTMSDLVPLFADVDVIVFGIKCGNPSTMVYAMIAVAGAGKPYYVLGPAQP
jgi:uncharacterized protein YbbC (DUF1343 family)